MWQWGDVGWRMGWSVTAGINLRKVVEIKLIRARVSGGLADSGEVTGCGRIFWRSVLRSFVWRSSLSNPDLWWGSLHWVISIETHGVLQFLREVEGANLLYSTCAGCSIIRWVGNSNPLCGILRIIISAEVGARTRCGGSVRGRALSIRGLRELSSYQSAWNSVRFQNSWRISFRTWWCASCSDGGWCSEALGLIEDCKLWEGLLVAFCTQVSSLFF